LSLFIESADLKCSWL